MSQEESNNRGESGLMSGGTGLISMFILGPIIGPIAAGFVGLGVGYAGSKVAQEIRENLGESSDDND